jgi:hypothetical protein
MPALVAGIHVLSESHSKTWMAGTGPAMTVERRRGPYPSRASSTALSEMRDQPAILSRNAM